MTTYTHPACCKNPATCALPDYRSHIVGFHLSATAIPSRTTTRTRAESTGEMLPDEPTVQTINREKRWERDIPAYKRLHAQGYRPRGVTGAALRESRGETEYDVTQRPVTIDYTDYK